MIKAMATRSDGGNLLIIGLSDANAAKLKQDCPIMAPFEHFGMQRGGNVIVTFLHPDGKFAMPEGANESDVKILLNAPSLKRGTALAVKGPDNMTFAIIRGETDAEMQKLFQGLIGPRTIVKHHGGSPSDIPPSLN